MKKQITALLAGAMVIGLGLMSGIPSQADDDVAVNAANFPDEAFRTIVAGYAGDDDVLSTEEIAAITDLTVADSAVSDLTGIEYLTGLRSLTLTGTSVERVNIMDHYVWPVLSTINFTDNTKLYGVSMSENVKNITITGSPLLYCEREDSGAIKSQNIEPIPYEVSSYDCTGFFLPDEVATVSTDNKIYYASDYGATVTNGEMLANGKFVPDRFADSMSYTYTCKTCKNITFTATIALGTCNHSFGDDGYCTNENCKVDKFGIAYLGESADVADQISLNLKFAVDPDLIENFASVHLIANLGTELNSATEDNGKFDVDEAVSNLTPDADDSNVYTLSVPIPAKDMTITVYATSYYTYESYESVIGGTYIRTYNFYDRTVYTTTMKEYVEAASALSDTTAAEVTLMNAMLKYGNACQTYFDYNTGNPASSESNYQKVDFTSVYSEKDTDDCGLKFVGSAMDVKSRLLLRYYFLKNDAYNAGTLTVTNSNFKLESYDDEYFMATIELKPQELSSTQTFATTDGTYTLSDSVFSYAARVQKLAEQDPDTYGKLLNVMYALYEYSQAADALADAL